MRIVIYAGIILFSRGCEVMGKKGNKADRPKNRKEGRKMATQLQPTPVLFGKDADDVLKQIEKKPTPEQIRKAEERNAYFKNIKKKGL